MIFSKIEIIDGEQYVKIDLLAEELKQKDLLKKENQELKDRIKELELQNFNLKEDIMIKKMSLPSEEIKDKNFLDLYNMPTYEELKDRIDKTADLIERFIGTNEKPCCNLGDLQLLLEELKGDKE